jgi:glycosyltransferase involved in cell wall biosynthesis
MSEEQEWPRITVVTPSYNQGQFIEETIRSVLLQGYPDLEYIIVDGGSKDESVAIIQKYAPWLNYWVSEADGGQANAINKGLAVATGHLFNWINSDDTLRPGALSKIALEIGSSDALAGATIDVEADGRTYPVVSSRLTPADLIRGGWVFRQQAFWVRRDYLSECGGIDESFNCVFDYDMTIRYLCLHPEVKYSRSEVATFRHHPLSKSTRFQEPFIPEALEVCRKLRSLPLCRKIHDVCDHRLRVNEWWDLLDRVNRDSTLTGGQRAVRILREACADPSIRISRMTFGAVRRAFYGGGANGK